MISHPPTSALLLSFAFAVVPVLVGYAVRAWYAWAWRRDTEREARRAPATSAPRPRLHAPRGRWAVIFPANIIAGGLLGLVSGAWLSQGFVFMAAGPLGTLLGHEVAQRALIEPFFEEIGKALPLLLLYPTRYVEDLLDGVLFGAAAGLGFAAVENLLYFTATLSLDGVAAWWDQVQLRVVLGTMVHGISSAMVGAYLGAAKSHGARAVRWAAPVAALSAGVFLHGLWNGLEIEADAGSSAEHASAAILLLLGCGVGILGVFRRAIRLR